MPSIKISQLPAKGTAIAPTDLVEISEFDGTGYTSKSITGQEIIDGLPVPPAEWGHIIGDITSQVDLQTELNSKFDNPTGNTTQYLNGAGTPTTLDKNAVGLGNVDNTSDLNKPISTATQTALNSKQATLVSGTNLKTINGNDLLGSGDLSVGMPSFVEYNTANSTIWNNGFGYNSQSTSFGQYALQQNWNTGNGNSAFGCFSLQANTYGTSNTSMGNNSLSSNTTGSSNTAVGSGSLYNNQTNNQSTAVGADALYNSKGNVNTAVGYFAGRAITTGISNTAIGANSLLSNTTGSQNVAIGQAAGQNFTTGGQNIAIGCQTGLVVNTGANNIFIGQGANMASGFGSSNNAVVIGASAIGRQGSVVLGQGATSTNQNQFVVGSSTTNAGTITTEVLASTKTWSVIINGVAQKILLA
jgi:hypothetical protein